MSAKGEAHNARASHDVDHFVRVFRDVVRACVIELDEHVIYRVLARERVARRVSGWRILWARRQAEVVIHRQGGGRLGSFRIIRAGVGFSCWSSGDRGRRDQGIRVLATGVDFALNCN